MVENKQSRCLVITDGCSDEWIDQARHFSSQQLSWCILPLGMPAELYLRLHERRLAILPRASVLDPAPHAEHAQQSVKDFYLPLMFELPRKSLWRGRSFLTELATSQTNLWWFLEISEKSPLRGPIFNQLYFVALVQAVLAERNFAGVWLSLADRTLSRVLKRSPLPCPIADVYCAPRFPWRWRFRASLKRCFAFRMMLIHVRYVLQTIVSQTALWLAGVGHRPAVPLPLMLFTRYPTLWKRPFDMAAEDSMYAGLQEELRKRTSACYGAWLELSPQEIFRHRRVMKPLFAARDMLVLNCLCRIGDILGLLSPSYLWRLWQVERRLVRRVQVEFADSDVSSLIRQELRRSLSSTELLNDQLLVRAISRAIEHHKIRGVIHSAEFQPIEKAIWYGARGKARTVAFQHSTIGKNKLQYYFVPGEIAAALDQRNPSMDMPLPDFFLTTGRYPFEVMKANGFPEERIAVCGALRYEKLASWIRKMPESRVLRQAHSISLRDKVLFITLSLESIDDAANLVRSMIQALPEDRQNIMLLIKCHPLASMESKMVDIVKSCGRSVTLKVLPPEASLLDFMAIADAVFLTTSSTAIEAAALGKTTVIYDNASKFTVSPVADVYRIGLSVRSDEEMKWAVERILSGDESLKALQTAAQKEVDCIFSYLDGTAAGRFAHFLQEQRIIGEGKF